MIRSVSRIAGLLTILVPSYLSNFETGCILFWIMTGLMTIGLLLTFILNPYALVEEPTDAFEKQDSNGVTKSKYDNI